VAQEQASAVELAGYLTAAVGVGEAARRYSRALSAAGVQVLERNVPLPGRDDAGASVQSAKNVDSATPVFRLICLNPEQMVPFLEDLDGRPAVKRTIGIWSWEVDVLPPGWRQAGKRLDEIWTYSRFTADLIRPGVGTPVHAIPLPVAMPSPDDEPALCLPTGFRFLVMFDFLSTLERKNPLGAIDAYKRAFAVGDGTSLVVKSVNGRHRPAQHAEVMAAIEGRPDISLIDQTLPERQRDALIAACDCCISLHRSEGYGLTLAEAMAIGKPVVATAHGGNMEFMSESNSYLIPCHMTRVGPGVEHYPAGATWADPDVAQAADALRAVWNDPQQRAQKAARGQRDVLSGLAFEVIGAQMAARLASLHTSRSRTVHDRILKPIATIRDALHR
jgi:glycosyltransferase involved in cell wall biosynthesis